MRPRDAEPGRTRRVTHRAGTWNLRVGRDPQEVAREVDELLEQEQLCWLAGQEAGQYVGALRRRLRGRYKVVAGRGSRSRRDSAVIVRRGLPARRKRVHSLGGVRWERGKGRPGLHPARHMTSVQLGRGAYRYRVGSVHLPPTPDARTMPTRGRAHAAALDVLERIVRRWVRWLLTGDWNMTPRDPDADELLDLADDQDGRGVDWTLSGGVTVTRMHRGPDQGSDHDPRLFTVTINPKEH